MSEHSDPREQVEASAEQELEPKDLEARNEDANQVRGGQGKAAASKPPIEIKDYSFDIENQLGIGS